MTLTVTTAVLETTDGRTKGAAFDVVCMLLEEPAVIRRFVEHYLRIGARRITLFYDAPEFPAIGDVPERVQTIACDEDFWRNLCGSRPPGFEERQKTLYADCHRQAQCDWTLFVDADEFAFCDLPIGEFLARVPEDVPAISLPTFEAVYLPGDHLDADFGSSGLRSVQLNKRSFDRWGGLIYGRTVYSMLGKGLVAHHKGKQFLRRGQKFSSVTSHLTMLDGVSINVRAENLSHAPRGLGLAHFDAISFTRWHEKWRRRVSGDTLNVKMSPRRRIQMELIRSAMKEGEPALRSLFRQLYGLSGTQFLLLRLMGAAEKRAIIPTASATAACHHLRS
jgi:hypothetical protein